MDIKRIAYEKYRLDWMLKHGYTLTSLMNELDSMQEESEDTVSQLFIDWEYGFGFSSEIWVCFDEFIDNEYQDKGYMKQLLNWEEYEKYEEDMKMGRIDNIVNFAKRKEEEKLTKEAELLRQSEECKAQIRLLKPRIKEAIDVGNACLMNGIKLENRAWGGHEGYDTHQFITNRWSHLVGFVQSGKSAIFEMGIDAGGACGLYDFRTDGVDIYDIHEETREKVGPSLHHMQKFLKNFDTFENEFYKYVDNLTK